MAVPEVDPGEIPPPSTLSEVENLIRSLYDNSASPQTVQKINNALQKLQTSPEGWLLANQLCASNDQQVQFFAALTFTVKLNTDWGWEKEDKGATAALLGDAPTRSYARYVALRSLVVKSAIQSSLEQNISEQDVLVLLQTLVQWLLRVIESDSKSFMWRKLCVTLVLFFIRFPNVWTDCVKHLLCCITGHAAVRPDESLHSAPPTEEIVGSLSIKATEVLLCFVRSLVDEVGKLDLKNVKNLHYHEKLEKNTDDAVKIMGHVLSSWRAGTQGDTTYPSLSEGEVTLVKEALGCFQSWVFYSQRAQIDSKSEFPQLKLLTTCSLHWIQHPQIYDTAVTLSSEILSNYFKFYTEVDVSYLAGLISSPWGLKTFSKTVPMDDDSYDADENTVFPQLVISFAEAILERLAKAPNDPTSSTIFEMIHRLLKIPGYAIAEEDVSCLCFEFWSALVELLTEHDTSTAKPEWWVALCKQHVFQAIEEYWRKLQAPPAAVLVEWTKDDKEKFSSFRKDVADLLETSYPLLHVELYERLVQHALHNLSEGELNWWELEATLYCINSLSDCLTEEPPEYKYLEMLLRSPLFIKLSAADSKPYVRTKIAGISLIGQYSSFFEENPALLPDALNFLFSSLPTPKLTLQASKSINSLCSSCRDKLTNELPTFVRQYQIYASTPSSDTTSRERVIGALGYIIQALPSEPAKLQALEPVISSIFDEFRAAQTLITQNRTEEAKAAIVTVLRSLVNLGKALQAPDDVPIVIGDGKDASARETCWETGQGLQIQLHIAEAINSFVSTYPHDRDVVEAACNVFRTGFSELSPGLLVFPPRLVGEFLVTCAARTTFFDTVISTSSAFICSHSRDGSNDIETEARNLTMQIVNMISKLQGIEGDPDFSQNAMEFFKRLFQKYLHILLALDRTQLSQVFLLALDGLVCKEHFPKKAAAHFWKDFIQLQFDYRDDEMGKAVKAIMLETGGAFSKNLTLALGGGAARSELPFLTEVLKKFVRLLESKKWLSEALFSYGDEFPSPKISVAEKNDFLNKVITLRGGRETNQVVNEFWLKCRGIEFAYVS